jgi:hypothetical protein
VSTVKIPPVLRQAVDVSSLESVEAAFGQVLAHQSIYQEAGHCGHLDWQNDFQ